MAKYKAPTYKPPEYNEAKYRQGIDTSFYTNSTNDFTAQAEKNRETQLGAAQKQQQSALKQAYITRAQNQRNLNQNLAMQGIRGGATETANLRLANQYGQMVGAANSDYANSVNTINQNIDQSIFDYRTWRQEQKSIFRIKPTQDGRLREKTTQISTTPKEKMPSIHGTPQGKTKQTSTSANRQRRRGRRNTGATTTSTSIPVTVRRISKRQKRKSKPNSRKPRLHMKKSDGNRHLQVSEQDVA